MSESAHSYTPQQYPPPDPVKRRRVTRIAGLVGGAVLTVVVLGAFASSCSATGTVATLASKAPQTSAQAVPPSPTPISHGETAANMGDSLTVTVDGAQVGEITVSAPTTTSTAPDEFSDAPKNGYYLTVTVVAKANADTTQTFSVNPFDFYVRTADGTHIGMDAGNALGAGGDDQLHAVELNPGETIKGTLTLDVPSVHGQLVYSPFDRAVGSWTY